MAYACSKCSIDQILFDYNYGVWVLIPATAGIVGMDVAKAGLILPDEVS